jgi:hypothetical protein
VISRKRLLICGSIAAPRREIAESIKVPRQTISDWLAEKRIDPLFGKRVGKPRAVVHDVVAAGWVKIGRLRKFRTLRARMGGRKTD